MKKIGLRVKLINLTWGFYLLLYLYHNRFLIVHIRLRILMLLQYIEKIKTKFTSYLGIFHLSSRLNKTLSLSYLDFSKLAEWLSFEYILYFWLLFSYQLNRTSVKQSLNNDRFLH